ncbi:MAG: M12 family metallo-peptidase, partial [Vicingaceae bacterium]|nr:M12 family metallo-peptidase [Vicingaceae bacterium]
MKKVNISFILILFVQSVFGQLNTIEDIQKAMLHSEYWDVVDENSIPDSRERLIVPNKYKALKLDVSQLKTVLSNAVLRTQNDFSQGVEIQIPTPIGTTEKFLAFKNTTMATGLEIKFPEIRTYDVVALNNSAVKGKIDVTPQGFHAMISTVGKGTYFVDPYARGDINNYIIYNKKDFVTTKQMNCGVDTQSDFLLIILNFGGDKTLGSCDLRTYRLAVAATGEYTTFHGGTVAGALAAQVTSMNRVNEMFERDAQISMTIIANNNLIIYTNGGTDPYTNGSGGAMLGENQANVDAVIGAANYDIGHVFSTGGGGIAQLQSPCGSGKARGVTGQGAPVNDPFDIDYVAHEMGHQFGGNHTQNNSCNRNGATAVEPGSASSIMGYAGICAPNVQNNSDDHFNGISVEEMSVFITAGGSSCGVSTATVNASPSITGTNGNITIPGGTPFALTATATDPNAVNVLSYCWEQTDNQVFTQPPVSTATGGPNFRSLSPSINTTRYFPNLTDLMAGGPFTWEVLSTVNRTMNFRVTVRDNAGPLPEVSCTDIQDVTVTVDASSGPFVETFPSATGITWTGATTETVTWNEAGTASGAVSCANVDILLSTDGGLTYPTTLASNVPNNGSNSITVPNINTTTAVVMVMCSNGTFFDISDNVFTINAGTPPPPPPASACLDTVFYPESKRTEFSGYQL